MEFVATAPTVGLTAADETALGPDSLTFDWKRRTGLPGAKINTTSTDATVGQGWRLKRRQT